MDTKIKLELNPWEVDEILCAISTLIDDRRDMLGDTACEEEIETYEEDIEELEWLRDMIFEKLNNPNKT